MPLVTWAALAYGTALFATFASGVAIAIALIVASAVVACVAAPSRVNRSAALALALVALSGVMHAYSARRSDESCASRLAHAHAWSGTSEHALAAGEVGRLRLGDGGCRIAATVLVESGAVHAGRRVEVSGEPSLSERGMLVSNARVVDAGESSVLPTLRARTAERIDRLFGTDAPMARALVIGDMSGIPADERDAFARAGLVHMLSVSGLHVGMIALMLELLGAVLRAPKAPSRITAMLVLAAYVLSIGAPAPAVRAAVMLSVLLVSRLMQRPVSPWAVFALGGTAPLVDPRLVLDLGWQLSVAGTAALIAGGQLAQRLMPKGWRGWKRSLATGGIVSIVATIATAPLVAWVFGRVALLGPVTNLLADPVMALLQPVLFLVLVIPLRIVETTGADAAHALLACFSRVAHIAARIPGAAPAVSMSSLGASAAGVAALAVLAACCAERPMRASIVAVGAVIVTLVEPILPRSVAPEIHMIDVGQGDAFALRTGKGRWILVDAGRTWDGGDAGKASVAPYIARRGGEVALFVLSHPHADHVGGAASLFALNRPARFLDPGYAGSTPSYRAALRMLERQHVPWSRVVPGDSLVVDDVVLTLLAPDSAWVSGLHDANLASTVMIARVGGIRVLFTGDAEAEEEDWLLDRYEGSDALRADVLKVGHHGSRTSTTSRLLAAVRPRLALVSVGAHNAYGHPDAEVMNALTDAHVAVLRTDRVGSVVLRVERGRLQVQARDQRWTIPTSRAPPTP